MSIAQKVKECLDKAESDDASLLESSLDDISNSDHSECSGCPPGDDSDSHCVCCNCNRGKQKMRKEQIRERLRKKLRMRKLHHSSHGDDFELARARTLLIQRLNYTKLKHHQQRKVDAVFVAYAKAELNTVLGNETDNTGESDSTSIAHGQLLIDLKSSLALSAREFVTKQRLKKSATRPATASPPKSKVRNRFSTDSDWTVENLDAIEDDVDSIFEPRKKLNELDPIDKEIEEFKLFCQISRPVRPRLKVPLVSLNLMS